MNACYQRWIEAYAARYGGHVRGLCRAAADEMVQTFPELRAVPGVAHTMNLGQHIHWWCEAPDGDVVDPTARQFVSEGGVSRYAELNLTSAEVCAQIRMGTCMNCGGDVYGYPRKDTFCSEECEKDFVHWQEGA